MQFQPAMNMISRITASKEVISAELGDEISLLNVKTGVYYTLNASGAIIWRQINKPKSLSEIKTGLLQEFAVDEERCERDLLFLVAELRTQGLIETLEPAS
jgi:hypothetical protein